MKIKPKTTSRREFINNSAAAEDINEVRRRAKSPDIDPSEVDSVPYLMKEHGNCMAKKRDSCKCKESPIILASQNMMGSERKLSEFTNAIFY